LDDNIYIHEIYLLIEQHSAQFDNAQFDSLILWIESKERTSYEGESAEAIDRLHNHTIRRWLSALKPRSEEQISKLTEIRASYDAKESSSLAHPSFDSYTTFTSGYDLPIELEMFDQLSVEQQATYCAQFKQNYPHEMTEEGLSSILNTCIGKNPLKYYYSLDVFTDLPSIYIYNILYGFLAAIRNNLMTEYSLLLLFVERTVYSDRFKKEEDGTFKVWRWVANGIADLFSSISSRRNLFKYKEEDIHLFNKILIQLLVDDRFMDDSDRINGEITTQLLNSTQGKLHTALLECTLIGAELYSKENERKWPKYVADYFSSRLNRQRHADKDFSIALGYYLSSLIFLDKAWVDTNSTLIFDTKNDLHLRYTLVGCFSIYLPVTGSLYDFFKRHDTFQLGLFINESTNSILDSIMRYCLWEWRYREIPPENDTSLFKFIIEHRNILHIQRLVHVVKEVRILTREQIIIAWKLILSVSTRDQQAFKDVFYSVIGFFDLYGKLDQDVAPLIKSSIQHLTEMGSGPNYLIRLLCKYGSSDLTIAADLLLETIRTVNTLPYADDEFLKLIEMFYKNNLKDRADAIALFFADKGSLFLKSLFDQYTTVG
jgi:hypothetical protein